MSDDGIGGGIGDPAANEEDPDAAWIDEIDTPPGRIMQLQHRVLKEVWIPVETMSYHCDVTGTTNVRLIVGKSYTLIEVKTGRLGPLDDKGLDLILAEWGRQLPGN